jgi:regulatory protein
VRDEPPPPDAAERRQQALELAYRHLGARDRTTAEVLAHLERRGVDGPTAAAAVADLRDQGYLDDARYAQRFAEDRRRLDAWADERIARRLEAAGVGAAEIEAALGEQDHDEARAAAVALLRRRVRVPPATDRERERALGMLVRRGYELELAYEAVRAFERGAA